MSSDEYQSNISALVTLLRGTVPKVGAMSLVNCDLRPVMVPCFHARLVGSVSKYSAMVGTVDALGFFLVLGGVHVSNAIAFC